MIWSTKGKGEGGGKEGGSTIWNRAQTRSFAALLLIPRTTCLHKLHEFRIKRLATLVFDGIDLRKSNPIFAIHRRAPTPAPAPQKKYKKTKKIHKRTCFRRAQKMILQMFAAAHIVVRPNRCSYTELVPQRNQFREKIDFVWIESWVRSEI